MATLVISYSRVRKWLTCRRQHWYRYVRRITRNRKGEPLYIGSVGHEMLAHRIMGKPWMMPLDTYNKQLKGYFAEERSMYRLLLARAANMVRNYIDYYRNDGLRYLRVKGVKCEIPLAFNLKPGIDVIAYLDAMPIDSEGRRWLMEHKFMKKTPPEEMRVWDLQTVLYSWWLPLAGIKRPYGVLWDYIRTNPPTVPELLQSGKLTTRKNLDTDYQTYYQAILDNDLDPADYEDYLVSLKARTENFFRRIQLPISPQMIREVGSDFRATAVEIQRRGGNAKERSMGRHCSWCDYQSICLAELRGVEVDFILKKEYTEKEHGASTKEDRRKEKGREEG